MPSFDGSGPQSMGAFSGRGFNMGRRCLRAGFGCRRYASPKNEISVLNEEEKILEQELAAIREQKTTLETEQK